MTEQQHPITPPPELVQQWQEQFEAGRSLYAMFEDIYRAGADVEFEACCEWMSEYVPYLPESEDKLRAARRPKPLSLKEQALEELDAAILRGDCFSTSPAKDTIRRALESIPVE